MLNLNYPGSKKTDKNLLKHSVSNRTMAPSEQEVKKKKPKLKKRKRLIIRNLSFKVEDKDLKEVFSKFGKILDVKIPLKADGKKRGFAFIEFEDTKSLIQAMKSMNYKEILGRKVAIDYAMDKTSYQLKVQSLKQEKKEEPKIKEESMDSDTEPKSEEDLDTSEEDSDKEVEDEDEKKLNAFLKEFDSGADMLTKPHVGDSYVKNSMDESSNEESEDSDDEDNDSEQEVKVKKEPENDFSSSKQRTKKIDSKDVSEGKTVFLRNVALTTSEESLQEAMEEFGECDYCLLCMDPLTDHPKGTAFVKYKDKSSADKLVQASYIEPGVVVDGRKLTCTYAISREDASLIGKSEKQKSDKRNLYLLRVGIIPADSEEAESMSKTDATKRTQLEMVKKQKLKNVNFFISDKRLLIHNLPPTFTDSKLRELFKKAAGRGTVITEARVMKEFKKTNAQGMPLSKGFGFVSFNKHEDALKALNELNNNPNIFTSKKRPIVEFSVENKVALLSKERRKEKMQLRNKRRTEEKKERLKNQSSKDDNKSETETSNKKKKRKNQQMSTQNSDKINSTLNQDSKVLKEVSPEKNQKKKNRKRNWPKTGKKTSADNINQDNISDLKQKYLDKLSNKL